MICLSACIRRKQCENHFMYNISYEHRAVMLAPPPHRVPYKVAAVVWSANAAAAGPCLGLGAWMIIRLENQIFVIRQK